MHREQVEVHKEPAVQRWLVQESGDRGAEVQVADWGQAWDQDPAVQVVAWDRGWDQDPVARAAVWGQDGDQGREDQAAAEQTVLRRAHGLVRAATAARHWFREWLRVSLEALVAARNRQKKNSSGFSEH